MYIDVHCHLDLLKDLDKVIENSESKNVKIMVAHGVNPKTNKKVLEMAEKYSSVKPALGIYPDEVLKLTNNKINEEVNFIRDSEEDIVAVGEIGLDGGYKSFEKQKVLFRKMVELAIELDKPVVVHSRKAEKEAIEILEKLGARKVVMHCFCGKKALVERIVKNKWSLSIPANVKNSKQFQDIVKFVPISQLLCETDSPFLHPDRKFPNTPVNVIESYEKISEIKGLSLSKIEEIIENNYKRLFDG